MSSTIGLTKTPAISKSTSKLLSILTMGGKSSLLFRTMPKRSVPLPIRTLPLATVGEKLDEVTKERDAAATSIPPEPLATFNKALHIHDGEAMAVVVDDDGRARDFTCGGCYMGIPIERVNAVLSRKNDLITCPSCGRILYAGEHLKSTMAAK